MKEKLVTIITPCYNTGKYVGRLLDSILAQTYPNIELIVVDDGSTDNTRDVVMSYTDKFEKRGYTLTYLYQENSGQSVALNNGLKKVKGEYLAWPDSDDFYSSNDAISKMVERLESYPAQFALARCQMYILDEDTLKIIDSRGEDAQEKEDWSLFDDCLMGNTYLYPGCYMLRFSSFLDANGIEIYTEKDAGQNWQMFLPVLYKYRCTTIKEHLFNVIARSSSHSRGQYKGVERTFQKWEAYERTLYATIDKIETMPLDEKAKRKLAVRRQYMIRKFELSARHSDISHTREYYKLIKEEGVLSKKQQMQYLCSFIPGLLNIISSISVKIHNNRKK